MCGRYSPMEEEDILEVREMLSELNRRMRATPEGEPKPAMGEVRPTNEAAVLLRKPEGIAYGNAVWGFPRPGGGGVVINARSETAGEKGLFAQALEARRCVAPARGFFEWKRKQGRIAGEKYSLRAKDGSPLIMAGLYSWYERADAPRFVILTGAANEQVAPLHDRMPILLTRELLGDWLAGDGDTAKALLAEYGAGKRKAPELIVQAQGNEQLTLF